MTLLEAKKELARKLDIDYADIANNDLFSDEDLTAWIQLGVADAWDYKPWPFAKGVKTAVTIDTEYYDHPSGLMNGSIYLTKVGGKEFKKILIEDYLKYLEDVPSGTGRIFAEIGNVILINRNAYTVGATLDFYGKKVAPKPTADGDLLPFSPITDDEENSGNHPIVLLAYSWALESEKKQNRQDALTIRTQALGILKTLWKPYAQSQALMQSKGRPFFDTHDFFGQGGNGSEYIGNFDYLN